jgi:hypothetical protein
VPTIRAASSDFTGRGSGPSYSHLRSGAATSHGIMSEYAAMFLASFMLRIVAILVVAVAAGCFTFWGLLKAFL